MFLVTAADERYIASVNQDGWSTKPSCSMPIVYGFAVRTCQAVSFSATICVTWPSLDRIT